MGTDGEDIATSQASGATQAYYYRHLSGVSTYVRAGYALVHLPSERTIAYCTTREDVAFLEQVLNWREVTAYEYQRWRNSSDR